MGKGPLRIQRKKNSEQLISFDPRLSVDKKTLVLRVESSHADSWYNYLHMIMGWAHQEIKGLEMAPDESEH